MSMRGSSEFPASSRLGKRLLIFLMYLWFIPFFLFAFVLILKVSFSEPVLAIPPYKPLMGPGEGEFLTIRLFIGNLMDLMEDPFYAIAFLSSLKLALWSTVLSLILGYPMAYAISLAPKGRQIILLLLIMVPFWTSFLIRVYAWIGILSPTGVINNLLINLHLITEPLSLLHTPGAVLIGMVYCYLPFMILPLYAALEKFDRTLLEAAKDLGARPYQSFCKITLPLTKSGIFIGCLLVFIPAVGEFVIPALLGGNESVMVGKVLWDEFFYNRDWTMASMLAIVLLAVLMIPVYLIGRMGKTAS